MASDWRQRQKADLRRQLYKTARALFESHGYDQTTVQQITEAVGVAKGTFFNHFPTKEHVVAAWYNAVTFDSLAAARDRPAAGAEATIAALLVDMAQCATDAPELMLAKTRHSANPLLVDAEQTQDDEIDVFVLGQCEAGKAHGELRADLDNRFFVLLLGDVMTGTARSWVQTQFGFDFPQVIRERIRFLFGAARC